MQSTMLSTESLQLVCQVQYALCGYRRIQYRRGFTRFPQALD